MKLKNLIPNKFINEGKNVNALKSSYEKAIKKEQELSSLMLTNLVKYKQAKASGDEKAIAKHTKIAGQLSPKKKKASEVADKSYQAYEDAISGLHADAELQIDEALARGLKPLLMIGSTIKSTAGEAALVKLSDKFDRIDDEQADDVASHLNMAIELMQDRSPSEARGWLKKFNIASKDALSGKSVKSAFENINEAPMDQNFQKEWETSCSALINHIKFEQSKNDRTNHRELSKLLNMVQDAQSVPEKLSKLASKEFPGQ